LNYSKILTEPGHVAVHLDAAHRGPHAQRRWPLYTPVTAGNGASSAGTQLPTNGLILALAVAIDEMAHDPDEGHGKD
jgi:hypothetical protein